MGKQIKARLTFLCEASLLLIVQNFVYLFSVFTQPESEVNSAIGITPVREIREIKVDTHIYSGCKIIRYVVTETHLQRNHKIYTISGLVFHYSYSYRGSVMESVSFQSKPLAEREQTGNRKLSVALTKQITARKVDTVSVLRP